MGWVILAALVIVGWWLVTRGFPMMEAQVARVVAWQREGRVLDRQVAEEAAELDDDAAVERWLREGGESV